MTLACAVLGVACGGAAMEPKSAPAAPRTERRDATPSGGAVAPNDEETRPGDKTIDARGFRSAQLDFDQSASAVELAGDDCAQLCKALSSMSRAADRLCELARDGGDDGRQRCSDARAKVEAARARVRAKCPACEPG